MKTNRLIAILKEADPSGELECCLGNADIIDVGVEPAYWDGCLEVLRRDSEITECNDIIGADYVGEGQKVVLSGYSISDMVRSQPKVPVGFIGVSADSRKRYEERLQEVRDGTAKLKGDMELGLFVEHVFRRCREEGHFATFQYGEHYDGAREEARAFYYAHYTPNTPFPDCIKGWKIKRWSGGEWLEMGPSHNDCRHRQWGLEVEITVEDQKLLLRARAKDEIVAPKED